MLPPEAGVGFESPRRARRLSRPRFWACPGELEVKLEDGSLRIRSTRAASRYGASAADLANGDGFVDTGDAVELSADRCYFRGRRGGS